ncbi:sensor domain-containing diguanylate cyclase [Paenibacillus sp. P96]|uniref:Sensor domain-containing diguanylate cyclase n=1 Tax=Paenibacillus zeirhizosphaerae TaxID=2987519 RepID=A0ABT9FQB0_9BACL|nr:sensor domain-containing diguanylate cyclase [Paenibacillus sp. P96]MDP4096849.1 sensor domain-containing diguanylate cyclase [Paenibacillus sp. P96]
MSEFRMMGHNIRDYENVSRSNTLLAEYPVIMPYLNNMDITSFDFPYLGELLSYAHVRWLEQCASLNWLSTLETAVFTSEGERLGPRTADEESKLLVKYVLESGQLQFSGPDFKRRAAALPVFSRDHEEVFAVLVFEAPADGTLPEPELLQTTALHFRTCFYQQFEYQLLPTLLKKNDQSESEAKLRSTMFQIARNMHDKIDVDAVLDEVFSSIENLFPNVRLTLFLSHDRRSSNPRVQQLQLHQREDNICLRAFMKGTLVASWNLDDQSGQGMDKAAFEFGIPLRGKQGIYGVFLMELPANHKYPEQEELDLITMLADTAGTAFENAKLLEQSNMLNHELRLINVLAQRLNRSLRLSDIFSFAVQELMNIFSADHCSIVQLNEEKKCFEVMGCDHEHEKGRLFPINYGFSSILYTTGEPIILSDYMELSPTVSVFMDDTRSRSLMGVPLTINGKVKGAILISHRDPHYFSYDNYKLLQMFAPHIGIAIMNASLHAQVERLANTDIVTGLYNRHYLNKKIEGDQEKNYCGSLILLDIDHFKKVNDTYGHLKGDSVLEHISRVIRASVREGDICARWGGEELAIYMPQAGIQEAVQYAERIRTRVAREIEPAVTVSCGIAEWCYLDEEVSIENLFYTADMALYRAKTRGRNQVVTENT